MQSNLLYLSVSTSTMICQFITKYFIVQPPKINSLFELKYFSSIWIQRYNYGALCFPLGFMALSNPSGKTWSITYNLWISKSISKSYVCQYSTQNYSVTLSSLLFNCFTVPFDRSSTKRINIFWLIPVHRE